MHENPQWIIRYNNEPYGLYKTTYVVTHINLLKSSGNFTFDQV
jgi:hypothetical protein